jgi:hypothetical protein
MGNIFVPAINEHQDEISEQIQKERIWIKCVTEWITPFPFCYITFFTVVQPDLSVWPLCFVGFLNP